jgi:hypothetical protein
MEAILFPGGQLDKEDNLITVAGCGGEESLMRVCAVRSSSRKRAFGTWDEQFVARADVKAKMMTAGEKTFKQILDDDNEMMFGFRIGRQMGYAEFCAATLRH